MKDPKSGVNAIWLACFYGNGEIMSLLAEAGADLFATNKKKINIMHLAVYNDNK